MTTQAQIDFYALKILSYLEQEANDSKNLEAKLNNENFKTNDKSVIRAIALLKECGLELNKQGTNYTLPEKNYQASLSHAICRLLPQIQKKKGKDKIEYLYGAPSPKSLQAQLELHEKPARFFITMLEAVLYDRHLKFTYYPVTDITKKRFLWLTKQSGKFAKNCFEVNLFPHYLVFEGRHHLLLGERLLHNKNEARHYDWRGINNIKLEKTGQKKFYIDVVERYRHSFEVWVGDFDYEIILIFTNVLDIANKKKLPKKINGTDEIIRYLAKNLGEVKVEDPPEEIVKAAQKAGLDSKKVFC